MKMNDPLTISFPCIGQCTTTTTATTTLQPKQPRIASSRHTIEGNSGPFCCCVDLFNDDDDESYL